MSGAAGQCVNAPLKVVVLHIVVEPFRMNMIVVGESVLTMCECCAPL